MRIYVVTEKRFRRASSGTVVTDNESSTGYRFWTRYLSAFDEVVVLGRVAEEPRFEGAAVEGRAVSVRAVPDFSGPRGYLSAARAVGRLFESVMAEPEPAAYLFRVPTSFGGALVRKLRVRGLPYGLEVIGDPHDVLAPGAIRHPLRPVLRTWMTWALRDQVRGARAVSYVTAEHLQRRYPAAPGAYTAHYSSIELADSVFGSQRSWSTRPTPVRLVFVGSLTQPYKGLDVLLKAVAGLVRGGLDTRLAVLGGGSRLPALQRQAAELGIAESTEFKGQVPSGDAVFDELDRADIFVLPSRTEGLPRALLEAMARGVPCIATSVGGIPELLPPDERVPPGDDIALARKLRELATNPMRMTELSRRNIEVARAYGAAVLQRRRVEFYGSLRTVSAPASASGVFAPGGRNE